MTPTPPPTAAKPPAKPKGGARPGAGRKPNPRPVPPPAGAAAAPGAPAPTPAPVKWTDAAIEAGAEHLIALLWLVARAVSYVVGGKLTTPSEEEMKAGAHEAVPLVKRFTWLALVLMFAGLPLWLVRTVHAHFTWIPKPPPEPKQEAVTQDPAKDGAAPGAAPAPAPAGATVHNIRA